MSGQSIVDRVTAARHSIAGHGLAKSVCKATTEEVMGPKKKHLDYLIQCTNEPNVSIPQLADLLIERTKNPNWVVVFKSLVTIHNLMNYGNERFLQYFASNNFTFNLGNFLDKTGIQGYDMSTFIRRYAKYLNEKAYSYRQMVFDFCKVKRGKEDGMLRTMNGGKLLRTLPALQAQLDSLLEFDVSPNQLTNGVINAAFMLMFKDLIRLFACYNDGIINLLEKYFEMNKKMCRESLDIYKKFLVRMEKVSEFLKVAENVGIDKGDIPDLAKAPSSLLDALEQHLQSLEGTKKGAPPPSTVRPAGVTSAINSMTATNNTNVANITEEEKQKILEEESKHLQEMKQQSKEKMAPTNPFSSADSPPASNANTAAVDLFGMSSPVSSPQQNKPSDDLLALGGPNPFAQNVQPATSPLFGSQPSATVSSAPVAVSATSTVWGSSPQQPGFDGFGEVMQPHQQAQAVPVMAASGMVPQSKLIGPDLDSSLASLAGNLNINGPNMQVKKPGHNWNQGGGEKRMTGGTNWQNQPTFAQPMGQPAGFTSTMHHTMNVNAMNMRPMYTNGIWSGGMQAGPGFQQPVGMVGHRPMGTQQAGFGQTGQQQPMFGQPQPQQPSDPFGAL